MKPTIVDRLYHDFREIVKSLDRAEVSLRITAEEAFRKNLLVTAASYFESEVKDHIIRVIENSSGGNETIVSLVRNKAIGKQYHTFFQWRGRNANSFFGLFGEGFKSYMTERVRADPAFESAIQAFLEIGNERNRLVHEDFGTFPMEKTSEEIFGLYEQACLFVDSLEASLEEYVQSGNAEA